jgi:hypothetical protein
MSALLLLFKTNEMRRFFLRTLLGAKRTIAEQEQNMYIFLRCTFAPSPRNEPIGRLNGTPGEGAEQRASFATRIGLVK